MAYEIDIDEIPELRPFKITDEAKSVRKSVMASTLRELKMKAILKLDMDVQSEVKILEDDGTQLDEEDYFQTLKDGAVLTVCLANSGEASCSINEKAKFLPPSYEEAAKTQQCTQTTVSSNNRF